VWGLSFPVMKYAVARLGPFDVGLARIALAALASLAFLVVPAGAGGRPALPVACRRHAGRLVLLSALVGYGQTFTMTYGLALTPATVGSLIPPLNPIATVGLAAWLLGEPVAPRRWAGLALAVSGVVLLALRDGAPSWSSAAGPAIMAVAPLSWAVYTVLSKPILRDIGPLHLTALTLGGGFAVLLPWADPGLPGRLLAAGPAEQAAVLFLGLVAMALAYGLWYVGLARIGAAATGATVLGIPLVGVAGSGLLLGERLTPVLAAAALLILGGLYLVVGPGRD
jgi:drug/metabolite transporter (DMT)-like permease